jgi:lysophospholipase L1-like esterase
LAAGLVLAEVGLQVAGVEIRAERLVRDPVLGWRNRPGWKGPVFSVNSRGFLGPEFSPQKERGTLRVFCLGESCTAGDLLPSFEDTYPRQVARELRERYPGRTFEVINAGVGGYSSFQGRLWLEREILGDEPDLVVIYFGWNDHWPARAGGPDREVSASLRERLRAWLGWSKVLQLAVRGYGALRGEDAVRMAGEAAKATTHASEQSLRVSPGDYEGNLKAMVEQARAKGGAVLLITAPNYLELAAKKGVPAAGAACLGGDRSLAEAIVALHARYNDVVRRVAAATGAGLLDAARDFESEAEPARLFWQPPGASVDFIHLSREGYARLARAIAASPTVRELVREPVRP